VVRREPVDVASAEPSACAPTAHRWASLGRAGALSTAPTLLTYLRLFPVLWCRLTTWPSWPSSPARFELSSEVLPYNTQVQYCTVQYSSPHPARGPTASLYPGTPHPGRASPGTGAEERC